MTMMWKCIVPSFAFVVCFTLQAPKFAITLNGNQIDLVMSNADGSTCSLSGTAQMKDDGFLVADTASGTCALGAGSSISVDGIRLKGSLGGSCQRKNLYAAKAWQYE